MLHFNFETCSAQFIQPSISLLENLFVAVSFYIVTGATRTDPRLLGAQCKTVSTGGWGGGGLITNE